MKTQQVFVDDVEIVDRMRAFDESRVAILVESIQTIGLQTPISVWSPDPGTMRLVAGRHRLEAIRRIGKEMIDAVVVDMDEIDRDLWEIDENLCRAELSPTEEGEHLARRKELWEARAAAQGLRTSLDDGRKAGPQHQEGFAAETSKTTGKSKRGIQQAIKRAHEVTSEARDAIRNTALDTGAYLDKLMKVAPEEQVERAQRDLDELARRQRDESLRREKAERDREAKEAKERARVAVCDFLLTALTARQWDQLIDLVEQAGGTLKSSELRNWQSPTPKAEAA